LIKTKISRLDIIDVVFLCSVKVPIYLDLLIHLQTGLEDFFF